MSTPLYNVQAAKELLGFGTHVATKSEIAKIKDQKFRTDPGAYKGDGETFDLDPISPTNSEISDAKTVQSQLDTYLGKIKESGSIFFSRASQGLSSVQSSATDPLYAITFDLILSETHPLSATACQHPVQYGAKITDHIQPEPTKIRAQILVTDYSIKDGYWKSPDGTPTYAAGVRGNVFDTSSSRAKAAYRAFKDIMAARLPVNLVTVLESYENLAITQVSIPRDGSSGEALIFDVEFTQIRTVKLHTSSLRAVTVPKQPDKRVQSANKPNKARKAKPKTTCTASLTTVTPDFSTGVAA